MTTTELTAADGDVVLHTGVAGRAARTGHRLTIAMREWSAAVTLDDDALTALQVAVVVDSLEVVKGEGGLTPLSGPEKSVARGNALKSLKADKFGSITYSSTSVTPDGDGYRVAGDLSICGVIRPHELIVVGDGDRFTIDTTIAQTDFGIKPFSLMMGSLKVADDVQLTVTVRR